MPLHRYPGTPVNTESRTERVRVCIPALLLLLLLVRAIPLANAQDPAPDSVAHGKAPAHPAWLDDAVIYEIFPRDFSAEGTLQAVTAKLDSLQHLGVNVLWIMPVHPIGKLHRLGPLGSPYSVQDYYAIDPDLGTKADFQQLVQGAHQRHMRVILDMVVNHTAWDSVMMAHPEFYQHDAAGNVVSPHGWSDVAALNYGNPALRRYIADVFLYWLKNFDLDGFRCDAASFVPTDFWEQLRPELKKVKPEVLLLAEASKPELMTQAFDLDYGWPLLHTLNQVIQQGEPASSIETQIAAQAARFPEGTEHMLISDDHDERRATVRYGEAGALTASALVFTLPGVPLLYNGMEAGDATESGGPQLFEKLRIDWGAAQQFRQFPEVYQVLLPLRQASSALRHGDLVWLHNSDEQHVISYERQSAEETDLIVANLSNTPFRGTVEAAAGDWQEVALSKNKPASLALPMLALSAFQVRIFRRMASSHR